MWICYLIVFGITGCYTKDPEQKIKVAKTEHVRLSDHLIRLSEQVTVANYFVRFLVAHQFA